MLRKDAERSKGKANTLQKSRQTYNISMAVVCKLEHLGQGFWEEKLVLS